MLAKSDENFTVFASTDAAMRRVFSNDLDDIFSGNLIEVNRTLYSILPQIMNYHILPGVLVTEESILRRTVAEGKFQSSASQLFATSNVNNALIVRTDVRSR
jgi:Fasciclin domain